MGGGVNTSAALAPDIAMLAAVAAATAGGGVKHSAGPNSSSHASTAGSSAGKEPFARMSLPKRCESAIH